jgi:hypothetical protein
LFLCSSDFGGTSWRCCRENGRHEDPEVLLSQAQREMTEMHARNRERAVQAITQKNNLSRW